MDVYAAAHTHAIWREWSTFGHLILSDRDRLDLMNRLSTNKLATLKTHEGAITLFLNANARILHAVHVVNLGDTALVLTPDHQRDAFAQFLRRNIFWNDRLQIENVSGTYHYFLLAGPMATEFLANWWPDATSLPRYHAQTHQSSYLVRTDDLATAPAYWIIATPDLTAQIRPLLQSELIVEASEADYERLRIEAGLAAPQHELTDSYIPLELGLWHAVSFNKGCYTGQEIIARMESRGKLARMLVKIAANQPIAIDETLYNQDGKQVGVITSAAPTQADEGYVGLAVVKRADATAQRRLSTTTSTPVDIIAIAGSYEAQYE